jgi:hypothetical protein
LAEVKFSLLGTLKIRLQEHHCGSVRKTRLAVTQAHPDLVDSLAVISFGIVVFWLVMAGLSVMAFDSGVSTEAWTFVIAVWSYPIWPLGFAVTAWIAYARKRDRLAGVLTTLTFLPVLVLLIIIVSSSFFYSLGL